MRRISLSERWVRESLSFCIPKFLPYILPPTPYFQGRSYLPNWLCFGQEERSDDSD